MLRDDVRRQVLSALPRTKQARKSPPPTSTRLVAERHNTPKLRREEVALVADGKRQLPRCATRECSAKRASIGP